MKALVLEDQMMYRDLVVTLLTERLNFTEVDAYGFRREAREAFAPNLFDLIVLDFDLPDGDGLELAEEFSTLDPRVRILTISGQTDDYTLSRVLHSGAMGFVDKTQDDVKHLEHAMREVMDWRMYFSRSVHEAVVNERRNPESFAKLLTEREIKLLKLFGQGLRNEEIAPQLDIEVSTVQSHRKSVMKKLGVRSSLELMRYALSKGFTRVSDILQQPVAD